MIPALLPYRRKWLRGDVVARLTAAVNDAMGARSQFAGLIAAAAVAIVLLVLTAPIADLPKAVLGAAIVVAATGLIDRAEWRTLLRTDPVEFTLAAVTAAGVVVVGVLEAIAFAVGLSIIDVVRRSARAGLEMLDDLANSLGRDGIRLAIARAKQPLLERLDAAGLVERLGADRLYGTVDAAVRASDDRPPPTPGDAG